MRVKNLDNLKAVLKDLLLGGKLGIWTDNKLAEMMAYYLALKSACNSDPVKVRS